MVCYLTARAQRLPPSDDFGRWSDYSEPPARGGLTWDACAPRERAAPCPSTSFGLGLCHSGAELERPSL